MASGKQQQPRDRSSAASGWRRERADPLRLVLAAAAMLAVLGAEHYGRTARGVDYYQFWVVGQVLSEGGTSDFYADAGARIGSEYRERAERGPASQRQLSVARPGGKALYTSATPLLYSLVGLISAGNYDADLERFQLLGLACTAGSLLLLGRLFGYSLAAALALLVLVAQWFLPLYTEMRLANVNRLQLAMLALFLWNQRSPPSTRRDLLGGFLLGFAVLFKPNVLFAAGLLGLWWLRNRELRTLRDQLAGMGLAVAVALAATSLSFGSPRCWIDWLGAASTTHGYRIATGSGNVGLSMLLLEWTGLRAEVPLTLLLVAISAAFLWRARSRRGGCLRREASVLAAGCLIYLLAARMVWIHYSVLALPAFLVALRPATGGRSFAWRQVLALAAFLPIGRIAAWQAALGGHLQLVALIYCASALTLYALMLAELAAADPPEAAAAS